MAGGIESEVISEYTISGPNSSSSLTIPLYIGFEMFSSVVISMQANIEFI
jgi:hypothetical protein